MSCPCKNTANARPGPIRLPALEGLPNLSEIKAFRAGQPATPYIVRGPADLRMLLHPRAILRPFLKPSVLVRIPELSPAACQAWQQRLAPLIQECGCNAGTLAVGIFLAAVLLAVFFTDIPDDVRFSLWTYLIGSASLLSGLILSAVAGKLMGQMLAALRLHRACVQLEMELNPQPEQSYGEDRSIPATNSLQV
jgi:uncharacterized integral membrane protein